MVRGDSPSWRRAKTAGDVAERAVAQLFHHWGYSVYRAVGQTEPDLLVCTTVEVKFDKVAARTGNLAVECSYRGRPSGLESTTAVWWAVVVEDVAYLFRVRDLQRWLTTRGFPTVNAGNGGFSLCVLVPRPELDDQPWVHRLDLGGATDGE